jgi:hypothetical protein
MAAELDSVLLNQIRSAGEMHLTPGATATARAIARDPWRAAGRQDTLAQLGPSVLSAGAFAGFAAILPAETRAGLATAPETDVGWFVSTVTERQALWHLADDRDVAAAERAVEALRLSYRDDMRALASDLSAAAATAGMQLSPADERQLAGRRVLQALEGIAARRVDLRPVPPLLLLRLLGESDWTFDATAIDPAIRRARVLIDAAKPARGAASS